MFHQVMLCISIVDGIGSIGFILGTIPAPEESGANGAHGTEATCKLQGKPLLGVCADAMLSLPHALLRSNRLDVPGWADLNVLQRCFIVILPTHHQAQLGRSSFQMKKWIVHGTLFFVGLVLSFAAIPFIERDYRWCYIGWPPIGTTYTPGIVLFILPVGISILIITVLTAMLVCFVGKLERKTARHSLTSGTRGSLASKTLWQSVWFLLAFYVVWPVTCSTYIMPMHPDLYWWYVIAAILSPAQGFFNACVFFSRHRRKIHASVAKAFKINKLKERFELSNSTKGPSRNLALSSKLPMASSKKVTRADLQGNVSEEAPADVPSTEPECCEQPLKDESAGVENLEQALIISAKQCSLLLAGRTLVRLSPPNLLVLRLILIGYCFLREICFVTLNGHHKAQVSNNESNGPLGR